MVAVHPAEELMVPSTSADMGYFLSIHIILLGRREIDFEVLN